MKLLMVFFELAFGFFAFFRICHDIRTAFLISESTLKKFVVFYLVWLAFWALMPSINSFQLSITIWIPTLVLFVVPKFLVLRNQRRFRAEFFDTLNLIILNMNNGLALRPAILSAAEGMSEFSRIKTQRIIDNLNFDSKNGFESDLLARYLIDYLKITEQNPHQMVIRLQQLREKFRIEDRFNQRKQRALGPARAQLIVLTLLYLATLIYVSFSSRVQEHLKVILISIFLYIFGAVVVKFLTSRFKWTV